MEERLHKLLAQHGLGSRRQVEDWIRAGRVLVNGQPAEIGQRVGPRDRVVVDGRDVTRRLAARTTTRVITYHKPGQEMLLGREGDDRAAVETRLPTLRGGRWLPLNALGYGEDGLLILSSDGTLASAIARQATTLPVEYRVRVLRPRETEDWPTIPLTLDHDGTPVAFSAVEKLDGAGTNVWFRLASERPVPRGAIRSLFDAAGLKVSRTMLVRWGPVALPRDLPRGRSRELRGAELDALLALAGRTRDGEGKAPRAKQRTPKRGPPRGGRATARRSGGR
ncbi:MAG: hypothetical protein EHM60_05785 [Lysobacterales bacterium]|nr:MAG: hypothetical protein EHM60_05785 [Xanthomonadales bacterium]